MSKVGKSEIRVDAFDKVTGRTKYLSLIHIFRVESSEKLTVLKKQLARNEKRIVDLKRLFMKIYEDNANGKLSDDRLDVYKRQRIKRAACCKRWSRACSYTSRPDRPC